MKLDVTKLPLGEALIAFVLAAVAVTFVLAFTLPSDAGIESEEAVAELSPTPAPPDVTPTPGGPPPELVQRGRELAAVNACLSCHSTTGEIIVGPSWKGLFGKDERLADGSTVTVDAAYVRESMLNPGAKIVEGFNPAMPSFSMLPEEDIQALIAFIQSVE